MDWLLNTQKIPPQSVVILSRGAAAHPRGVRVVQVDCTNPLALRDCTELMNLTSSSSSGGKDAKDIKVAGIFHLAGQLDDGMLTSMKAERFRKVVAPKAALLTLLEMSDELGWQTPWALAYSSTTSLLGYPGQSNYGAANSLLDSLASYNRSSVPVVVCNWGPWGEVGMAQAGSKAYSQALKNGELPMTTPDCYRALESLFSLYLDDNFTHFSISRTAFSQSEWSQHPTVSNLADDTIALEAFKQHLDSLATTAAAASLSLNRPSVDTKECVVESFLASRVSVWKPAATLAALGVDSLDEVQLRNEFQREFKTPTPLSLFNTPNQTLATLATNLRNHLKI